MGLCHVSDYMFLKKSVTGDPLFLVCIQYACNLKKYLCFMSNFTFFYPPSGGADDNLIEGGETKFLCKPGARNITVIFQPLLR